MPSRTPYRIFRGPFRIPVRTITLLLASILIPLGAEAQFQKGEFYVLDGFGGIHVGGALRLDAPDLSVPYFGSDIARAIVSRAIPPRINGGTGANRGTVPSTSYLPFVAAFMHAPDDGAFMVTASVQVECDSSTAGKSAANLRISVDGTPGNVYNAVIADCTT